MNLCAWLALAGWFFIPSKSQATRAFPFSVETTPADLVTSDGGDGSPAEFSVSGQLSGGGENPVVAGAWEVYDKLSILYPQMAERLYIYDSGSQAGAGSGQLSGGVDSVVTATVQEVFDILDETAGLPVNVTLGGSGAALMQPSSFHLHDGGSGCAMNVRANQ